MAAAKPAAGAQPQKNPAKAVIWVVLITAVVVAVIVGVTLSGDSTTVVPAPPASQRAEAVAVLARNSEAQGVCYGWQLQDGPQLVSEGSNLGDGISVTDAACPRWAQVVVSVTWTAQNSELDDWAHIRLEHSADLDQPEFRAGIDAELARFGLTEQVFIDDPGWATTRAALVLPLLFAETGTVAAVPTGAAAPAATLPALPNSDSDLWRDRWVYLLAAAGLLLVTALLVTVGLVQRRRQRRAAGIAPGGERSPDGPPQSASRTRMGP